MDAIRLMYPLFESAECVPPTSATSLWFGDLSVKTAIALNRLWHSRLPHVIASNITRTTNHRCYGASCDGVFYASAIWSSPVSRRLPHKTCLELRRLAIAPDAPKNTASRILGWIVRDIKKRYPTVTQLVSYQDKEVHTGTIYRASGWTQVTLVDPRSRPWNVQGRSRNKEQSTAPKQRWEKWIGPQPQEVKGV